MSTNKDITLYLDNRNPPPVVNVSQGDTDWLYRFTVMYNNAVYSPSVTYVILTGHKPDGHVFAYRGAKSGNLYTVTPANANGNLVQMTAVTGDVPCELRLISGGRSVGTANFILRVEPGPEGVVTVASASALPAYTTILQELGVLIGKVETLPDDVPGWIGDWLEEHISGGQGVAVDNTLSIQGAAADAKETGDRLRALEGATIETDDTLTVAGAAADAAAVGEILGVAEYALGNPDNWVRQIILDGTRVSSENRIATEGYLPQNVTHVTCASGYSSLIHRYTASGEYAGFWSNGAFSKTGSGEYRQEFDIPQDNYKYVLVLKKNDNANITRDAATNISSNADGDSAGLIQDVEHLEQRISVLESNGEPEKEEIKLQGGAMWTDTGATGKGKSGYKLYQITKNPIEIRKREFEFSMSAADAARVNTISIYEYTVSDDRNAVFVARQSGLVLENNSLTAELNTATTHVKVSVILTDATLDRLRIFVPVSVGRTVKDFNAIPTNYTQMEFVYPVSNDHYTFGNILLPPNYSMHGKPVPLYVQVHGTGGMTKWSSEMGINDDTHTNAKYLEQYMANEGFAVFDCYPWTDKYTDDSRGIYSLFAVEENISSYIEGIKYICDRWNVDINAVCMSFYSLGGHLGYWFANQTRFKPRALAMLAPSTSIGGRESGRYFMADPVVRQILVDKLGLGNLPNANDFVTASSASQQENARTFVRDNLDAFAGLIPSEHGVIGATHEDIYNYCLQTITELPQWMVDKNIPAIPSGLPAYGHVLHPDLYALAFYPVKFWCAFDDVNTQTHANYAMYRWMLNSGADVQWRTMPNGTGGHYSVSTGANAPKSSGTTRLGIAYSNIATAYVEMADFFFEKLCMD